ncbi:uncharacterized protein PHALS_13476 [Plasmopara halstedii]|uniref:Uncharacterized protein n=1 Tax=Plasmopara halstedii TaxID=4781 RepID=A0A0P1AP68_PLAHL|nr:uncharacterized protein PHALS_13476 [Plasmopara halstedii]CEG43270.1 hypothetical protein PHALS_13476 [Plasmopara halstedii]|eukprot:XP_024579639.1 hypothetical protein PHALS_13476 [Plasmopara halstedii]
MVRRRSDNVQTLIVSDGYGQTVGLSAKRHHPVRSGHYAIFTEELSKLNVGVDAVPCPDTERIRSWNGVVMRLIAPTVSGVFIPLASSLPFQRV